jgi:hypothetical protein
VTITKGRDQWQFCEMFDEVHVDEKWFYLTKMVRRYILAADKNVPEHSTHHKSHVEKVMFLCAQARPRHDTAAKKMWDRIGEKVLAQCTAPL